MLKKQTPPQFRQKQLLQMLNNSDTPEDLEEELVIEDALRYDHDFENPLELDFLDDTPLHDLDFEEDFRSDVMLGRNSEDE